MSYFAWLADGDIAGRVVIALALGSTLGAGLFLIMAAAFRLSRAPSAALRHQVLLLGLCSMLLIPALVFTGGFAASPEVPAVPDGGIGFGAVAKFADMQGWQSKAAVAPPSNGPSWIGPTLCTLWFVGALLLLFRQLARLVSLVLLQRRCESVTDLAWRAALDDASARLGLHRRVELLAHPRVTTPMAWGPPRPFVLLPLEMAQRAPDRVGAEMTLLHELAHLERRDSLWKLLADVACALLWFQPAAWAARRCLGEAEEMAADSRVLDVGVRPSTYSSHLLALFRSGRAQLVRGRAIPAGVSAMAGVGSLTSRVCAILDRERRHRAPSRIVTAAMAACFFGVLGTLGLMAQQSAGANAVDAEALHDTLNPVFANKMADDRIAGAAISVVRDGELVYSRGFGRAEVFGPEPVDAERTIFRIGSVTKVVTAIAVMQCVDRGLLELDADVNDYLKDFQVDDSYPDPVRVRHLLTHTAGFDQLGLDRHVFSEEEVVPLGEFLRDNLVRIRPPGQLTCYDTYGITLAGYLVEVVSGLGYEEYLERNIFAPLGMERSFINVPEDLRADLAVGYEFRGEWTPQRWEHMNTDPASTVNSTVVDMAKLTSMLLEGGAYGGQRILSKASASAMMRSQFRNHPDQPGYGFILTEDDNYGISAFSHGGSMTGFGCFLYLVPEERLGVFVAYNQESGGLANQAVQAVVDLMVEERSVHPLRLDRAEGVAIEPFLGTYANNMYNHSQPERGGWSRRPFEVTRGEGDVLLFDERRCVPVGPDAFLSEDGVLLTFLIDDEEGVTHMLVRQTVFERLD